MAPLLESDEFLPSDLHIVANFNCGNEIWAILMERWIKSPPTAKFSTNCSFDTSVWLYYHPDGRLVGFGSLGTARWKIDGERININIIPCLQFKQNFSTLNAMMKKIIISVSLVKLWGIY